MEIFMTIVFNYEIEESMVYQFFKNIKKYKSDMNRLSFLKIGFMLTVNFFELVRNNDLR